MRRYLLDTNIFIQAHRVYYPFDVVPHLWNKFVELSERGLIFSIDKVKNEICYSNDPDILASWCLNELNDNFFIDSSSCVDVYADISNWVYSSQHYTSIAKINFFSDGFSESMVNSLCKEI